jgi:hypothetical protein
MNSKAIPDELPLTVEGVCNISVECWRLGRIADLLTDSNEAVGLRHATRRITEELNAIGIRVLDFAGRSYNPGLVPVVVEVHEDDGLPDEHSIVAETISPTVTWRGQVIKPGQIIVKRSPLRPRECTEVVQ